MQWSANYRFVSDDPAKVTMEERDATRATVGAAIVPLAGAASPGTDEEALDLLSKLLPGRQIVGTPGLTISFGGGGPHCITPQVPARVARS